MRQYTHSDRTMHAFYGWMDGRMHVFTINKHIDIAVRTSRELAIYSSGASASKERFFTERGYQCRATCLRSFMGRTQV